MKFPEINLLNKSNLQNKSLKKDEILEACSVKDIKTNKNNEHRRALTELKSEILDVDLSRLMHNSFSSKIKNQ